jgi:hypothetical protein
MYKRFVYLGEISRCDWVKSWYWSVKVFMKYGLWTGLSGPKIACAMTRSQTWRDVTSRRNRTIWRSACTDDVMMSALRSCSALNCVGPVGEATRGGDLTSFLKDKCEALGPKCVWRMMHSVRSRTKISEIGFGVLQIGGFLWNLQRENDINRVKKWQPLPLSYNRETYHEMSHLYVTSEGDISKFFMNTWREWTN